MTISGTLAEWREWTGLPFDHTGDVLVPFALNPVHCDVAHDHAVYVEPGVWVHHEARRLRDGRPLRSGYRLHTVDGRGLRPEVDRERLLELSYDL